MMGLVRHTSLALMLCLLPVAVQVASAVPQSETQNPVADASEAYGAKIVAAARAQLSALVIYNPSYQKIPYPNGDIPSHYGVCTDVIVRAYRALGIDLQERVHKARVGSGDTNIDHRRVEVLRKYFKRKGKSLPVSANAADYKPGDIVTQYIPEGWFSTSHIAIISDKKSASGVPLIIHNRGFGVTEEDWLFAQKITGHYRYQPNLGMAEK